MCRPLLILLRHLVCHFCYTMKNILLFNTTLMQKMVNGSQLFKWLLITNISINLNVISCMMKMVTLNCCWTIDWKLSDILGLHESSQHFTTLYIVTALPWLWPYVMCVSLGYSFCMFFVEINLHHWPVANRLDSAELSSKWLCCTINYTKKKLALSTGFLSPIDEWM